MLNFNSALKKENQYNDLTIKEISPVMKLMFKQVMESLYGKNVLKLEKNLILPLMALKQCMY